MSTTKDSPSKANSLASFTEDGQLGPASPKKDVEALSFNEADLIASADEKQSHDPNIVGWNGPDDPENPMNWTSRKKVTAIGIVSLITILSYVLYRLRACAAQKHDRNSILRLGRATVTLCQ